MILMLLRVYQWRIGGVPAGKGAVNGELAHAQMQKKEVQAGRQRRMSIGAGNSTREAGRE